MLRRNLSSLGRSIISSSPGIRGNRRPEALSLNEFFRLNKGGKGKRDAVPGYDKAHKDNAAIGSLKRVGEIRRPHVRYFDKEIKLTDGIESEEHIQNRKLKYLNKKREEVEEIAKGKGRGASMGVMTNATVEVMNYRATNFKSKTFAEMSAIIPPWLVNALAENNIIQPTRVQQRLIEALLERNEPGRLPRPILLRAQTGTGKSLGYVVALLAMLHREKMGFMRDGIFSRMSSCNHLVLVPNAILGRQLLRWIKMLVSTSGHFSQHLADIVKVNLPKPSMDDNGGQVMSVSEEESQLNEMGKSNILISTPNIMRGLLATGQLNVGALKTIILDEADTTMKPLRTFATKKDKIMRERHPVPVMTFLQDLSSLCESRQRNLPMLLFTSASLNKRCREDLQEAGHIGNNSLIIQDGSEFRCPSTIKHYYRMLVDSQSIEELVNLIVSIQEENAGDVGAVFIPAARSKTSMRDWLRSVDIPAEVLTETHSGRLDIAPGTILVGSDVDARGWDLPSLRYVIVVDLPNTPANYLHMAGRVGRMGGKGKVYSFVAGTSDLQRLTNIFSMLKLHATPYVPFEPAPSTKSSKVPTTHRINDSS